MANPFVRIIVQVVVSGVGIIAKGLMGAYARGAAGGGKAAARAVGRRGAMEVREARQVLNFTAEEEPTVEEVLTRFHKHFVANDPAAGGSLYLQSKIFNAKDSLLQELEVDLDEYEVDAQGERVVREAEDPEDGDGQQAEGEGGKEGKGSGDKEAGGR